MGVEGLHFGSAFPAGCKALGVTRDEIARHETKPDFIQLPPMAEAPAAPEAPEPAGSARDETRDDTAGPAR